MTGPRESALGRFRVRRNFPGFSFSNKGERQKTHANRVVQMWFGLFRVNQPYFYTERMDVEGLGRKLLLNPALVTPAQHLTK